MPRKSEERQAGIDYSRRGRELNTIKDIRLGDPYARLILFVLDNMLGTNWSYIDKTIEEVRLVTEIKRSTFHGRISLMQSAGLISVEDLQGNTTRKRWRIVRSNLDEAVQEGTTTILKTQLKTDSKPRLRPVQEMDPIQEADASVQQLDESVQQVDGASSTWTDTILHAQHAPTRPPTRSRSSSWTGSGGRGGGEDFLIRRLADLGVRYCSDVVEISLSRGCSTDEIHAVIDYWEAHHEEHGWGVGALTLRVKACSPGLPVEQGKWPPVKPQRSTATTRTPPVEAQEECPHCGGRPPHFAHSSGVQCSDCNRMIPVKAAHPEKAEAVGQ